MLLMKRTAVAALLMLAPVQASADQAFVASGRDLATAVGEMYGFLEFCHPNIDRSMYRRAETLDTLGLVYPERALSQFSLAWESGSLRGHGATCDMETFNAISARFKQAGKDSQAAVHKALSAQSSNK